MDSTLSALAAMGLNEKEARVYLACLELGSATIQEIARKSGVKRTSIYNFLEDLKHKGLVSEITRKHRTYLMAEDPQTLLAHAEENRKKAEREKKMLEDVLPQLMGIFNVPARKPKVRFYEGIEGIKKVYEDTLTTRGPILAFSDYEKMFDAMTFEYMVGYAERRAAKGIRFRSLAPHSTWDGKVTSLDEAHLREQKFVTQGGFDTEINIYGNKVALISFRRPYAAVIIEDSAIATTLRTIWKMLREKA